MKYVVLVPGEESEVYGLFDEPTTARHWAKSHWDHGEYLVLPLRAPS